MSEFRDGNDYTIYDYINRLSPSEDELIELIDLDLALKRSTRIIMAERLEVAQAKREARKEVLN